MSFPCMCDTNSLELMLHGVIAQMFCYVALCNQKTVIELRVNTFNSQMECLLTLVIIYKLWKQGDKQLWLEILELTTKTYFIKYILCVKCGQELKKNQSSDKRL